MRCSIFQPGGCSTIPWRALPPENRWRHGSGRRRPPRLRRCSCRRDCFALGPTNARPSPSSSRCSSNSAASPPARCGRGFRRSTIPTHWPEDSPISSAVSVCSSARCRRRTIRRRCHKSRRGSGRHPSAGPSGFGRGRQRCGNGPIVRRSGATWCGRRSTNGGPHRFGRMALGRRPDDSTARSTPSPGGSAGRSTSTRQPSPRPRS